MRAVVVVFLIGCAGAPPAEPKNTADETPAVIEPPAPEPVTPAERSDQQAVELAVRIVSEMAEAAAGTAGMCEQQGAELSGIAAANRDVWEQLGAIAADEARAGVLETGRESLEPAMTALFEQIQNCAGDPGVRAALEAMAP